MDIQPIAVRVGVGLALGAIPANMMRKDKVKYGAVLSLAALVGYNYSGGYFAAAVAAAVLIGYQLYLRVAVKKISWVIGTCVSLSSYLAAHAVLLPARLETWDESFVVRVFVGSLGVALAMLVACIEFKVRTIKETIKKDLTDAAKSLIKKV